MFMHLCMHVGGGGGLRITVFHSFMEIQKSCSINFLFLDFSWSWHNQLFYRDLDTTKQLQSWEKQERKKKKK